MLQSSLHIEIPEVISDPERGRICDPLNCLFDSRLPSTSPMDGPSAVVLASTLLSGPTKKSLGVRFRCSSKRVLAFGNTREDRGVRLLSRISSMTDFLEL